MLRNVAGQTVNFQMILKASGDDSGDLTATAVIEVNVEKVGFVAGQGTLKFLSNGTHEFTPTQAETDGSYVAYRLREATAITALVQTYPITQADYKADVSAIPARDDADTYRTLRDGAGAIVQQIREQLHTAEQP